MATIQSPMQRCNAVLRAFGARYRRRSEQSELFFPEPHALKPGIGLLKAPAVIALEHVGDGEHQVKGAPVVAAAGDGGPLQGIGELQELQLSEPVALLKSGQGVVLLVGRELGGGAGQSRGRP
jgi:hypothetical protein